MYGSGFFSTLTENPPHTAYHHTVLSGCLRKMGSILCALPEGEGGFGGHTGKRDRACSSPQTQALSLRISPQAGQSLWNRNPYLFRILLCPLCRPALLIVFLGQTILSLNIISVSSSIEKRPIKLIL
jgi:hypothetical protein